MDATKYTMLQRVWHWLTVALILLLATTGMLFFYEINSRTVIQIHQVAGQAFLLVLVARILTKAMARPAAIQTDHAQWEKFAAATVHALLYLAMVAYVATGYVSASALRDTLVLFPVSRDLAWSELGDQIIELHYLMKWVLLTLVTVHVAAALKHALWDRDTTFSNIWFSQR